MFLKVFNSQKKKFLVLLFYACSVFKSFLSSTVKGYTFDDFSSSMLRSFMSISSHMMVFVEGFMLMVLGSIH